MNDDDVLYCLSPDHIRVPSCGPCIPNYNRFRINCFATDFCFFFFFVDNFQFLLFSPLNSLLCHSFSYIIDSLFSNSSKSMCVLVNIAMKRFFYDLTKYPMIGNNDFLSFVNRKLHTHAHTHSHTYFILTL